MSTTDNKRMLLAIAADQGGYFTASQARDAGYSYPSLSYHVSTGEWLRIHRGIYRLSEFPAQVWEDLIVLTLLSSNRAGEAQAVVSHETALAVHEISDANPAKIHLTVPPRFKNRMPPEVILHSARITKSDWEDRGGYRVTTPLRTILDIASSSVSWPFLEGAVRDALRDGLVRRKQLLAADGADEVKARLRAALKAAEYGRFTGAPNAITRTASQELFMATGFPPTGPQASSSVPLNKND